MSSGLVPHPLNFEAGWWFILAAFSSGALIGLGFHREDFLGGYGSPVRRLLRLGHVALAALGTLNVVYGLCPAASGGGRGIPGALAGQLLMAGTLAMPAVCFLSAWRRGFRHFFFIPVALLAAAVVLVIVQ